MSTGADDHAPSAPSAQAVPQRLAPMDAETYELILAWRKDSLSHISPDWVSPGTLERHRSDPRGTFARAGTQYTPAEQKLREDFAKNKMRWVGQYWPDLWYFTINTNPFVAMCFSHPLHPVGRTERYVITLFQALFVMIVSCGLSEAQECLSCGIVSCDVRNDTCHQSYPEYQRYRFVRDRVEERGNDLESPPLNWCCAASTWGMVWAATHITVYDYQIGLLIYALVANVIFGQLCFCFAMCACCQAKPMKSRRRWERCGQATVVLVGVVLGIWCPWFLTYVAYNGMLGEVLTTFCTAKLTNAAGTTAFQTLLFTIIWRLQEDAKGFHVTANDYQKYVAELAAERSASEPASMLPTLRSGSPDPTTLYSGDAEGDLNLEPQLVPLRSADIDVGKVEFGLQPEIEPTPTQRVQL